MKKNTKRLIAQLVFIVAVFTVWELYYYNVIEPSGKTLLFPELRSVGKAFMNAFTFNAAYVKRSFNRCNIGTYFFKFSSCK